MRALLPLLAVGLAGCSCGSYTAKTGFSFDGVSLDRDDYIEECGPDLGTSGSFDLLGDGMAWLDFAPGHPNNDLDWNAVSLDLELFVPNTQLLEAGTKITDATGDAYVASMSGEHYAVAWLDHANVEVVEVGEPDERCTPFRAQAFKLAWDIEWGTPEAEYYYAASGTDWVSLVLDESSSDEECL